MTRRPDLFIIGAAKCGTTSIHEYLKGHPEVFMSPRKEPRYFAPDLITGVTGKNLRYGEDLDRYLALFDEAGDAKRLGEASVRYIYSKDAPRLIHDFDPNAFIVAMIRNPVDMMFSFHSHRVAGGAEEITDFEHALAVEEDRKSGRLTDRGASLPGAYYRDRARFGEQLPRWFETFGPDRVHVIVFEDFVRDPATIFRRLLEFLEVDPDYQPEDFRAHNPRHRPRSAAIQSILMSRFPQWVGWRLLPALIGDRATRRLLEPFRRLNRTTAARESMRPELRRQLEEEFAPDVERLSQLLDRDLTAFWFKRSIDDSQPKAEPVLSR